MSTNDLPFGKFVKSRRESLAIPQKVFAEKVGISPAYLSDIENGNRRAPEKYLARIAMILGISDPDELSEFYDKAGISQKGHHYDINVYIHDKPSARRAFRTAMDEGWTDDDWREFIEIIKRKNKQ